MDIINPRLLDIFITGPFRIYISKYIKSYFLKLYILTEGIFVIAFNLYTYLHINKNITLLPYKIINSYSNKKRGKPQIHRLFNIFVMYPIHVYILYTNQFTSFQFILFLIITFTGFVYNTYNYIHY